MKSLLNKIIKNRNNILMVFLFCIISILIIGIEPVSAGLDDAIVTVLGWIAYFIAYVIGLILTLIIGVLVDIAQYSDIINVKAVSTGWVIVRDLCNMFFILILLVIAFATILRVESYNVKKLLPKLLIMAVLINFSKMICGLIIDFAQVIMLTFVSGFAVSGGANFVELFQINKYLSIQTYNEGVINGSMQTAGAILAGLFAMIITLIVMIVLTAVLVMRIVMLWIYVILSPLAFLLSAFPAGAKYSSQWWGEFSKQVVVGPILAFFLWLALLTANESAAKFSFQQTETSNPQELCAGENELLCNENFKSYIITIALLIGGLMVTQQMGGVAGAAAAKGLTWSKKAPLLAGKGMAKVGSWGARKFALTKHGFEIRPSKIIGGIKETLQEKTRREDIDVEAKSAAMLSKGKLRGALGASRDFSEDAARGFMWSRAWKGKKSTISQTRQFGRITKEIDKLEDDKKKEGQSPADIKNINKKIENKREELDNYKTPYTFHANQKKNAGIREQMGKLFDIDNEEQLATMLKDNVDSGQKELASAIALHMAKVGHSNEAMELVPAKKDVRDDKGNLLARAGNNLPANNAGLKALFDQYFIAPEKEGGMGMSEQEARSVQSQFSTIAKQANHFNVCESVGVKNGLLYARSDADQQNRAHTELMKADMEGNLRRGNRLMHGGEIQFIDKSGNDNRVMINDELTERNFVNMAPALDIETNKRKRLNPSYAQGIYKNFLMATQQQKTGDLQNLPSKLESIVDIINKKHKGKTFTTADGNQKSLMQLAGEVLRFGKEKYKANMATNISGDINMPEAEKEVRLRELEKEDAEMDEEIEKILRGFPSEPSSKKPPSSKSKEEKLDEHAKMT